MLLRRALAALSSSLSFRELALLAGLGLTGYGCAQIYPPAGFIAPGAVLLYVAICGVR